ncbi:MAG: HU family DNA-binding protein [Gammaproteobacteria bacterium]|nr:HU family DNA-binding protein [Gammaproteobacteria bacterium]
MNKTELISEIATRAELSTADAGRAFDATVDAIGEALKNADTVSIIGFGTFSVKHRGERTGRNPRTGETIRIPASSTPAFKAGKALKDAVSS